VTGLQIFDVSGAQMRFGLSGEGRPYVVAEDFTPRLGYSRARNALRMVDEDEKGAQIVSTPGGPQRMDVLYEDGIWELIFLSRKPEAKEIKKRVKAILRQIRETGSYAVATAYQLPQTFSEALRAYAAEVDAHETTRGALAEAVPKAESWDALADAEGDYSVREAAQILDRDPGIATGQNRLFAYMREIGWLDGKGEPYQAQVENGRLVRRTTSYSHPHTGEPVLSSQVRVTAKGVEALRRQLTGGQLTVIGGGE
jgi:prophage antirepressor-like protein